MKKHILTLLCLALLTSSLASCGNASSGETTADTTPPFYNGRNGGRNRGAQGNGYTDRHQV